MVRFGGLPSVVVALVVLVGFPTASRAQELLALNVDDAVQTVERAPAPIAAPPAIAARSAERPTVLLPLYASFITLQVLDIHSTQYALDRGAVEGNPMVKSVTGSTAAMAAMKAAGTAGVIFASEKLRAKNKAASIALMVATNSMMIWVVQHNYGVVR